jgi:uncharacterized membrane protein
MKTVRIPAIVLTVLLLDFLAYLAYSAKLLPEKVATHFGAGGLPNGWMSRSHYLLFLGAIGGVLPLINVIVVLFLGRIPNRLINLPNKEYWLSDENREQTLSYIAGHMLWLACLEVVFFAGLHYLTIQANRAEPVRLEMAKFLPLIIGFVAAVILWSITFILHFKKTDN